MISLINKRIIGFVCFLIFTAVILSGCNFGRDQVYLINSILTQFRAVGIEIESEEGIDPGINNAKEAVRIKIEGAYLEIYEFEVNGELEFVNIEAKQLLQQVFDSKEYQGKSAQVKKNVLIVGIKENPKSAWIENALFTMDD